MLGEKVKNNCKSRIKCWKYRSYDFSKMGCNVTAETNEDYLKSIGAKNVINQRFNRVKTFDKGYMMVLMLLEKILSKFFI